MTDRYIKVLDDGSRSPSKHPGWRVEGETPETARLMTPDELADFGWYLVVDDIPAHDPATQFPRPDQMRDWPIRGKRIVRTFTLVDRPPPPRRKVPKAAIVRRLDAAGRLQAAVDNRSRQPLLQRELWDAAEEGIYADDPDMRNYIAFVGANPDDILAPPGESPLDTP